MTFKVSAKGLDLIKRFEGCHRPNKEGKYSSYRCPAGRWTIGYGHTKGVRSGQKITQEQALTFLEEDAAKVEKALTECMVALTQPEFDAIASFIFNVGVEAFEHSTLLKKLRSADFDAVPEQLARWDKATVDGKKVVLPGLTRRRAAEIQLYLIDTPLGEDGSMAQKVTVADVKPLKKSRTLAGAGAASTGLILTETAGQLEAFTAYSDYLKYAFIALSVAGLMLVAYARYDDQKKATA